MYLERVHPAFLTTIEVLVSSEFDFLRQFMIFIIEYICREEHFCSLKYQFFGCAKIRFPRNDVMTIIQLCPQHNSRVKSIDNSYSLA